MEPGAKYPVDISRFEVCINPVAGRYPKLRLTNNGRNYIVKFAAYRQNGLEIPYHISEYAASRVINSLGYGAHEVWLAVFRGRPGCLVKLFDEPLFTFGGLGTSTLSGENLPYDLDLLEGIYDDGKFTDVFTSYMWDTFLLDSFILNLDRHPNNWGFHKLGGLYEPAPLFDNSSSLYSLYAFDLGKITQLERHIEKFSFSKISYKGERMSFRQVLLEEKSRIFQSRLELFIKRLASLDLGFLSIIKNTWPVNAPYTEFIQNLLGEQVKWFETEL